MRLRSHTIPLKRSQKKADSRFMAAKVHLLWMMEEIYLEFLPYCLDDRLLLSENTKNIDRMQMMDWAEELATWALFTEAYKERGKLLVCLLTH